MEKKPLNLYLRLGLWAVCLVTLSLGSFHFNSQFEEKESSLIDSMKIVRNLRSGVVDFQMNSKSRTEKEEKLRDLISQQEKLPVLEKLLMRESFGEKYFNESRDLKISYQQYLHKMKNSSKGKSPAAFRKLQRELNEIDSDIYAEIKKVSIEKILWGAGGDFALILLALLGGVGIAVFLKDEISKLEITKRNLLAKLESNNDSLAGGAWTLNLTSKYFDLSEAAIDLLNMNIYEPHISFKNFLDYFTDETAKEFKEQLQLCSNEGERFTVELQKRGIADESSWINISGTISLSDGVKKVEGVVSDIDQLRQTEDRFKLLFSNIEQPAFIAGENGLWDCNKAALKFFKLRNKEDFLDKKLPELFPLNQPDGMGSIKRLRFHMKKSSQDQGHRFGWCFRHDDGETKSDVQLFPIVMNGTPLYLYVLKKDDKHVSVIKDKKFRVIICDPNVHSRNILQSFFEEEDWLVQPATSMADALSHKEDAYYDIIAIDLAIKDLNLDLFTLNQNDTHLVGMGGGGNEDPFLRNKVDSYIQKPIMKEVVSGLIQKVSGQAQKLIVEDVLDLYSSRYETLITYCNELEVFLENFKEQFEKDLQLEDWNHLKENLLTLQTISKKFSCRGLNQLFESSFSVLESRNALKARQSNEQVLASLQELIFNLRAELRNRAA